MIMIIMKMTDDENIDNNHSRIAITCTTTDAAANTTITITIITPITTTSKTIDSDTSCK